MQSGGCCACASRLAVHYARHGTSLADQTNLWLLCKALGILVRPIDTNAALSRLCMNGQGSWHTLMDGRLFA